MKFLLCLWGEYDSWGAMRVYVAERCPYFWWGEAGVSRTQPCTLLAGAVAPYWVDIIAILAVSAIIASLIIGVVGWAANRGPDAIRAKGYGT